MENETVEDYGRFAGHFRDRLGWQTHPEMPGHLRGFLRDKPGLTLFLIELCEDKPDRGRLSGALIPDEDERTDDLARSKVWFLQNSLAPRYLAEFVAYMTSKGCLNPASPVEAVVKAARELYTSAEIMMGGDAERTEDDQADKRIKRMLLQSKL